MSNAMLSLRRRNFEPWILEPKPDPRPHKPIKPAVPNRPRPTGPVSGPRPGKPPLRPIDIDLLLGVRDGIEQLRGGWTRFGERP